MDKEVNPISEYICENAELLNSLADRFIDVFLEATSMTTTATTNATTRVNNLNKRVDNANQSQNNIRSTIRNMLIQSINETRANNGGNNLNNLLETERGQAKEKFTTNIQTPSYQYLGDLYPQVVEQCNKVALSFKGKIGSKQFNTGIAQIMKFISDQNQLRQQAIQFTNGSEIRNPNTTSDEVKGAESYVFKHTKENGLLFTECINPFYDESLLREDDYGNDYVTGTVKRVYNSKTGRAVLLTVVTFVVTTVLTNIIRVQLGGTPGGSFAGAWEKGIFDFFSCLILAPIIEEPAKMIAVKGGYGKHFFFAFNFLEFAGYILMFMHLGTASIGFIIILRALAVIFHAITMRIHGSAQGQGAVRTTTKLAICILLHFMFNAIALKYAVLGVAGLPMLMFAIGFMGVAFGVFKLVKKGISSMTGRYRSQ